jgi:hypothetical protein
MWAVCKDTPLQLIRPVRELANHVEATAIVGHSELHRVENKEHPGVPALPQNLLELLQSFTAVESFHVLE